MCNYTEVVLPSLVYRGCSCPSGPIINKWKGHTVTWLLKKTSTVALITTTFVLSLGPLLRAITLQNVNSHTQYSYNSEERLRAVSLSEATQVTGVVSIIHENKVCPARASCSQDQCADQISAQIFTPKTLFKERTRAEQRDGLIHLKHTAKSKSHQAGCHIRYHAKWTTWNIRITAGW